MAAETKERSNMIVDRLRSVWNEHSFEFGIPVIDLQHIYLLYTFIELGIVCDQGDQKVIEEKSESAFSNILEFTSEHFFVESDIFRQFEYPQSKNHLKEHMIFIQKMKRRNKEKMDGNREVARQLVGDLMSWLFDHILKEDKQFVDFYYRTGIPVEEYTKSLVDENIIYITPLQLQLYQQVTGNQEMLHILKENISMTVYHLWKNYDLDTGIPLLDIQHLWFVRIMVRIDRASRINNRARRLEELQKSIKLVKQYIEEHFLTEELMMDHFNFPDSINHKKEHKKLIDVFQEREKETSRGDLRAVTYLAQDLKEWLLSHIAINDKYFFWFFREFRTEAQDFSRGLIENKQVSLTKGQINLYKMVRSLQTGGQQTDIKGQNGHNVIIQKAGRKRI